MQNEFNYISGILLALGPIVGLGSLGIVIYLGLPTLLGAILASIPIIAGIWIGYSIFKKTNIVGPFEVMTALHASPDLDNLIPGENSETKLVSPLEYVESIKMKRNTFKGGSIRIYGDWFGEPYQNVHIIQDAEYHSILNELIIRFSEGYLLQINNPKHIFEASTFMKIIDADSVKLEFLRSQQEQIKDNTYYLHYTKTTSSVESETNIDWYKPNFDTSLGEPALVIFGQFE